MQDVLFEIAKKVIFTLKYNFFWVIKESFAVCGFIFVLF